MDEQQKDGTTPIAKSLRSHLANARDYLKGARKSVVPKMRRPTLSRRPSINGVVFQGKSDINLARSSDYATEISEHFAGLDTAYESESGKNPAFKDSQDKFLIAEFGALRSEILSIKTREIDSEKFYVTAIAVLYVSYFQGLVPWFVLLIPILFIFFGLLRLREYQRNIMEIDAYLREREMAFFPNGAWVNYFFARRKMEKYFETREWFWIICFLLWLGAIIVAGIHGPMHNGSIVN